MTRGTPLPPVVEVALLLLLLLLLLRRRRRRSGMAGDAGPSAAAGRQKTVLELLQEGDEAGSGEEEEEEEDGEEKQVCSGGRGWVEGSCGEGAQALLFVAALVLPAATYVRHVSPCNLPLYCHGAAAISDVICYTICFNMLKHDSNTN